MKKPQFPKGTRAFTAENLMLNMGLGYGSDKGMGGCTIMEQMAPSGASKWNEVENSG
jgi:hypothetical protein